VVVGLGGDGDRVDPGRPGFVVTQPGARRRLVEDLHDLGAEAARELPVPAEGVFPGDPALLVRGGAERQVALAEQPVVGDHAVPGSEHIGQIGPHPTVDRDRAPGAQHGAGFGRQGCVGPHPDHDHHHVGQAGHRRAVGCGCLDLQPSGLPCRSPADPPDSSAGQDLYPIPGQFGMDQRTQPGVDGGKHLGQLLHLDDRQPADGERVGYFQADVAGADDDRAGWCGLLQGPHNGEGVAHRVQHVHPVGSAKSIGPGQAADRRLHQNGAGADDELVIAQQFLRAISGGDKELAGGHVDPAGRWCPAAGSSRPPPGPR
jgi:hypothetical protein